MGQMRYDRDGDFDHPLVPAGHESRARVLFRLAREKFADTRTATA